MTFRSLRRVLVAVAVAAAASPLVLGGAASATGAFPSNQTAAPPAVLGTATACPVDKVTAGGFGDIASDFFTLQINCLADYGITRGSTATSYAPTQSVTRGEMAGFFFRIGSAAGHSWSTGAPTRPYTDAAGIPSVFQDAVFALTNARIVAGYADGSFRPAAVVSRGEMSKFIYNFLRVVSTTGAPSAGGQDYFSDDDGTVFESPYLNGDAGQGLYVGTPGPDGGQLALPTVSTRRDEMAGFLTRVVQVLVTNGQLTFPVATSTPTSVPPVSLPTPPAGPSRLTWLSQPANVQATTSGSAADTHFMCPPVQVQVAGGNGNGLAGVSVTLGVGSTSSGNPGLGGALAATTDGSGIATFGVDAGQLSCTSGVAATTVGFGYTLAATATLGSGDTLHSGDSAAFNVLPYYQPCGATCSADYAKPGANTQVHVDAASSDANYSFLSLSIGLYDVSLSCADTNPYRELVSVDLENHAKTVTLTWDKKAVQWESDNGTPRWPVCFGAPYPFTTTTGEPAVASGSLYSGLLPDCAGLATSGPCVVSRGKQAANEVVVVALPNLPGDPYFH